jgi:dTDP-glucose 4,6-dehydratase
VRVLITGGAGFIGSNLAHYWLTNRPEDSVVVYDSLTYAGHRESLSDLESHWNFTFVRGDIRDPSALGLALKDIDLVLHLAAESHNDRAIRDPILAVETNVLGTSILLEACRKSRISRLHHVSTDEVYGSLELGTNERFTLDSPYAPRGPYSASKASSDHMVRAWFETYGLPSTISNSGNNFGPYQHPEKLIPRAITNLFLGRTVPLYGDGLNVRDWIFVDDHCSALDLIVHRGKLGQTYLVSARMELSNIEVIRRILRHLGKGEDSIEWVPDRPGHDRRYALEAQRLTDELGWRPAHDFDQALTETIEWYRRNPAWWRGILPPVPPVNR